MTSCKAFIGEYINADLLMRQFLKYDSNALIGLIPHLRANRNILLRVLNGHLPHSIPNGHIVSDSVQILLLGTVGEMDPLRRTIGNPIPLQYAALDILLA